MNAKQYQKMRLEQLSETLMKAGITEYKSVTLSSDQQEYQIVLTNGDVVTIPSGLPYH